MKKLLITGFEPFGGEEINPSWETVSRLPDEIGGYTLTKLRIPVVFGKAADAVLAKAAEVSPDAILCIGQAGGRNAFFIYAYTSSSMLILPCPASVITLRLGFAVI